MTRDKSRILFERAKTLMPGGVNSPVRACKSVGSTPVFISRAQGSHIFDVDGNDFLDYIGSWGPMILGHGHERVVEAVKRALADGISYGAPTEREIEMAEIVVKAMPSIEMVRMVSSGTEATMSAVRLARAFTGRDLIVKFDGCYHGHADTLLIKSGSGIATLGIPGSPGIPKGIVGNTVSLPYNDIKTFTEFMDKRGKEVAAVIVEPVAANMGVVRPAQGFLEALRLQTGNHHALLIFDEVITGFRLSFGGAQHFYQITPDITCLGKIIGGGLPVGAYGGSAEIMCHMAPEGSVYQAGTLSGNPLAMAAGIETLRVLCEDDVYKELEKKSSYFWNGLEKIILESPLPLSMNHVGSLGTIFFNSMPVTDYETAVASNRNQYSAFYQGLMERSIYVAPSQFEAIFVSLAHTEEDLAFTIDMMARTLASMV